MDVGRLRASWARIAAHGDQVALYFYSDLFLKHPEVRDMFPVSMAVQRAHLTDALVRVVAAADDAEALTGHLAHLGRAHRKYGVQHDGGHYKAVGESLLATFEHFSAEDWTPEVTADWAEAYGLITQVMTAAAAEDEKTAPAWWTGTITSAERRVYDITVLHVRPEPALEWVPGQSVPVEIPARPRLWRWYSPANSPGDSGTLELHVRLTGPVSAALTNAAPGTRLCLGPAAGELCWRDTGRDVLLVAGSTGLAPLKAICGHLAAQPAPPHPRRRAWCSPRAPRTACTTCPPCRPWPSGARG